MLPEILTVTVDDGARTHVPLTPSTTFQDVSECVRDPGEPLPLILEQSPAGLRLVAWSEHPLEVLALWGKLKSHLNYIVSYSLTKHFQNDDAVCETKWPPPHPTGALKQIDPWELYDLRDQLKGLGLRPRYAPPSGGQHAAHRMQIGHPVSGRTTLADESSDAESPTTSSSALSYDTNESLDNPSASAGASEWAYNPNGRPFSLQYPAGLQNALGLSHSRVNQSYQRAPRNYYSAGQTRSHIGDPAHPPHNASASSAAVGNSDARGTNGHQFVRTYGRPTRRRPPAPVNGPAEPNDGIDKVRGPTRRTGNASAENSTHHIVERRPNHGPHSTQHPFPVNGQSDSKVTKVPAASLPAESPVYTVENGGKSAKLNGHLAPTIVAEAEAGFRRSESDRGRHGAGGGRQKFWRSKSLQRPQPERPKSDPDPNSESRMPKSDPQEERMGDQSKQNGVDSSEVEHEKDVIRIGKNEGMKNTQSNRSLIPDGAEVTVPELREMASRQQHQIETQQQLLVAREQRLKYLKMQEGKATQINQEAEKLRRLRDRVEAQEAKLRRLRALRGQVDTSNLSSASLSSDLDAMRSLFSEKEKELVMAAAKVEELTRQLEDLRTGRTAAASVTPSSATMQKHHQELDKLRRELLYRNSVNREASVRVASQREALASRKEEIVRIDKRIAELQQRLQRKKILNQQLATQISAATQAKQAQLKAIEQKELRESKSVASTDDLATEEHKTIEGYNEFERGKHDPKYQTLPHNTKFSSGNAAGRPDQQESSVDDMLSNKLPDAIATDTPTATVGGQSDPSSNGYGTVPQSRYPNAWEEHGTGPQNLAMVQEIKSSMPATSLSVSFAHKLSPGVTTYSQNRTLNYSKAMEDEAKTKGVSGLINDYEGDVIGKPQLPPKPPVRPTPPPRQKGEPGSVEPSESLTPKVSAQPRPQQAFRYASQNVIMSTYTQKQDQTSGSKPEPDSAESGKDDDSSKVRVSLNRRIEMPPAFMFPEGQLALDASSPATQATASGGSVEPEPSSTEQQHPTDVLCATGALRQLLSEHESALLTQQLSNLSVKDAPTAITADSIYAYAQPPPMTGDGGRSPHGDVTDDMSIRHMREDNLTSYELGENGNADYRDNSCSSEETGNSSESASDPPRQIQIVDSEGNVVINRRVKKGNLKTTSSRAINRRVSFDPLALLLDASLEGELDLVKKTAQEVPNPSAANDEGITALHNAICAGHLDIVTFLVLYGYDVNAQDADGWTPLHCAASCNNVQMARFLVDHGACVLATTLLDHETAAEKCEQEEDGYDSCSQYLYSVQEKLGIMNGGVVYAVYDYDAQTEDEFSFNGGDAITVLRRGDEYERNWWWSRLDDSCGYAPRNLLGLYPRVKSSLRNS